jgi:hypothetical protein
VEVTELGRRCGREAFAGLSQGTDRLLTRYSPDQLQLIGEFLEQVRAVITGQAAAALSAATAAAAAAACPAPRPARGAGR